MKTCIYFAGNSELSVTGPTLALGWGFTEAGLRQPGFPPGCAGVVLDDRRLPDRGLLDRAEAALRAAGGTLVCDFERPPDPVLEALLTRLRDLELVVPAAYAGLPHAAVLTEPYRPGQSFRRWLRAQQDRYGAVVLDGSPLRHRVRPGCTPELLPDPLPETGCFSPGSGCLTARRNGDFLFWDSRETLRRRCETAGIPVILLWQEWNALPPQGSPLPAQRDKCSDPPDGGTR